MGSMGYLLGGALAGAGKGMETVGAQAEKEQTVQKEHDWQDAHDQTMERLRAAEQNKLQQSGQEFQHGERLEGQDVAAKVAGAQRQFLTEQQERSETGKNTRAGVLAKSRTDAAAIHAAGSRKPVPEFTRFPLNEGPTVVNGQIIPGRSYSVLQHKSGQGFVSVGGMYLPYRAGDTQFPDPKSVARAPAAKVALLAQNPDKMMDFFEKYHYIPENAVSALQQLKDRQSSPGVPGFAPKGTTMGAGEPMGGQQEPQSSAGEDAETDNAVEGDYGNTGDRGPQASDNTQAQ